MSWIERGDQMFWDSAEPMHIYGRPLEGPERVKEMADFLVLPLPIAEEGQFDQNIKNQKIIKEEIARAMAIASIWMNMPEPEDDEFLNASLELSFATVLSKYLASEQWDTLWAEWWLNHFVFIAEQ